MPCSVTMVVELTPEADMTQMEAAIQEAGRQAMWEALKQAVRSSEAAHPACPHCGGMRWCRANASAVVALRVRTLNTDWSSDGDQSPLVA